MLATGPVGHVADVSAKLRTRRDEEDSQDQGGQEVHAAWTQTLGKGSLQASASSNQGRTQCSSVEGDEMQRLKEELQALRQENAEVHLQIGRGKSRREM